MGRARLFAVLLTAISLASFCLSWASAQDDGQDARPRGGRRGQGGGFGQGMFGPGFGQGMFGPGGFGQGMWGGGMFGQGGGRGGRGSGTMGSPDDPFQLLRNDAVREDLKLTKKQIAQTDKLLDTYQKDVREQMEKSRIDPAELEEMSDDERAKALQKARDLQEKTAKKLNDKYRPRISKILKPDQEKRLKQISWQVVGVAALRGDDLAKALKLTKEQRTKIDDAFEASGKQMRDAFRPPQRRQRQSDDEGGADDADGGGNGGGGNGAPFGFGQGGAFGQGGQFGQGGGGRGGPPSDFRERFENMRKMGEERDAKVLAVLTDKQRDQFEELKGDPFDVSQLRPRWGRGGRGGPPGAGDQANQGNDRGGGGGRRGGRGNSE